MHIFSNKAVRNNVRSDKTAVSRRSFLRSTAITGASLAAGAVIVPSLSAATPTAPTAGDISVLQFLAGAELIECDLWQQYAELASGNDAFRNALRRIDPALPDYVLGDFRDECSHAEWINTYLSSIGATPVDLDSFRTLPSVEVEGALDIGRLTNLRALTIDTSYYNRYRGNFNPDFGDTPPQAVTIKGRPTVPTTTKTSAHEMQVIAQTAAFHFGAIEQGGGSLYNALISNVTNLTVLRILASIGPTEIYHFAAFMTSLENIVSLKDKRGNSDGTDLVFPAINRNADRGQVTPKPCTFLNSADPLCSVIRPRSIANAGAVAAATNLANSGLFTGNQALVDAVVPLAMAADNAVRGG